MNNSNRNQLAADSSWGVYPCENPTIQQQREGAVVLLDGDFLAALAGVKDGETIYGNVSDEIARQIEEEYGIR